MRSTLALVLDLAVSGLLLAVVFIIFTGGGVYHVAGIRLSARTTTNPLLLAVILSAVRLSLRSAQPFLRLQRAGSFNFSDRADRLAERVDSASMTRHRALKRVVVFTCIGVVLIKLGLAWMQEGFFSGDDVEVHEMTLAVLLERAWPVWSLRNAFYPMAVIYPGQWVMHALGIHDPAVLVYTGRAVVAVLSTLTIFFTWRVGRRLFGEAVGYALVAALLVAVNKLHVAFGSTELPRPVATVLLVLAFLTLLRGTVGSAAAAGALVGVAAAFRYSEATFLAAGLLHLALERQWTRAVAFGMAGAGIGALVVGAADVLYWGSPFYSLHQAVDYTLVNRLSSRGYQPIGWYVTHVPEWSTWPVIALAAAGTLRAPVSVTLWAWVPVLVLSLLPHKEARYLVPSVPFISLLAAYGVQALIGTAARPILSIERSRVSTVLAVALVFSVLQEAGDWRLRRTDADVTMFEHTVVPALRAGEVVSVEQAWRVGGHLYLPSGVQLVDLDPSLLSAADLLQTGGWIILDVNSVERLALRDDLGAAGYIEFPISAQSSYRVFQRP